MLYRRKLKKIKIKELSTMPEITAQMVKKLRDQTDAGMMDCKNALLESNGDMEAAVEHLRKTGIMKAAKKASRSANEGRAVVAVDHPVATMVEVLCETDFAARNEKFLEYSRNLAQRVITDYEGDKDLTHALGEAEKERLGEMVGQIGENMQVRRAVRWESKNRFAHYLHMGGKIGALAELEGEVTDGLANDICMHIAAFNPRFVSPDDIDPETIRKEREIAAAQVQNKPPEIMEKIVSGKINKWYSEVCLSHQPWLRDDKTCLSKAAPQLTVKRFVRWQVGEEL